MYYTFDEALNFNERKVYNFNLSNYTSFGDLKVVKLIPIYEGGREGSVISELIIEKIEKKDLSTKSPTPGYITPAPTSPSGSSGGTSTTCTASRNCDYYYNLNQCGSSLSNGCKNILNCNSCPNGKICDNGNCVNPPSCTTNENCTTLNSECKRGLCNLTSGICFEENLEDGTECNGGTCEQGNCVLTQPCKFTSAYWNASSVIEGRTVRLTVEGQNCQGQLVNYNITRLGQLSWNPFRWFDKIVFSGTSTTSMNWVAGQNSDGVLSTGTHRFEAILDSNASEKITSGNLVVESSACVPESPLVTCGSWVCGYRKNNCGEEISCGPCGEGEECSLGVCVEK